MKFCSKVDRFFLILYSLALLIVAASVFFLFFIEDQIPASAAAILIGTFILIFAFMLWLLLHIKYVFHSDHLFVKGGPFQSRILYKGITRVSPTNEILTGYRILSTRDGIEIFYRSALMGSVKISPKDREEFLAQLKEHAPESAFHKKPY